MTDPITLALAHTIEPVQAEPTGTLIWIAMAVSFAWSTIVIQILMWWAL